MPEIDVTDVLLSSDIAGQSFDVIRRAEVVDETGFSTTPNDLIALDVIGSVQPTGDNSLIREDAYDAQAKTIRVITSFRMRGVSRSTGASRYKPDIVRWNGDHYEVRVVDDYTPFGGGMVECECVQVDYVGTPTHPLFPSDVGQLDFSRTANSALFGRLTGC